MQMDPTRRIFALSLLNHIYNADDWQAGKDLAKIRQLEVYREIPHICFHKTSLFECVFNEVKLKLTPRHILTEGECVKVKRMGAKTKGNGPSPASAGSSGAKISRFVLHMAMKNNTAVAPPKHIYLTHSSSWANRLHCFTVLSCTSMLK